MIVEGEQRTPERYESPLTLGGFFISHKLRRNPLLGGAEEDGTRNGRLSYIGIGHRALLPVGCVGKYRGRNGDLPAPVRIVP